MKRILVLVLALCFLSTSAFAWGGDSGTGPGSTPSYWKTWTIKNTTGAYTLTSVSNDIIAKGNVILGFQIMPLATSSENVVTIYDGGITSSDEIIGEAECAPESFDGLWFPRPRVVEKQIYIHQGPNTQVMIFFE
jgi:hypothetical protein